MIMTCISLGGSFRRPMAWGRRRDSRVHVIQAAGVRGLLAHSEDLIFFLTGSSAWAPTIREYVVVVVCCCGGSLVHKQENVGKSTCMYRRGKECGGLKFGEGQVGSTNVGGSARQGQA